MNAPLNPTAPSAAARLDESRAQLRRALLGDPGLPGDSRAPPRPSASPAWLVALQGMPVVGLLVQAAQAWWVRHPLHLAGSLAATTADAVLKPIAQRHPLRLVLGAAALGGLLAWSRPWRWVVAPALFAGLLPQLLSAAQQAQKSGEDPPPRR
ncbi:MAG: hypothetical protein A3E25_15395 [Burkholderiales bacterium RIFCSPHIGHO2_12_FULL_69_20]|nr:MAG: hypothetical protein A3E25_15395 [Burkholderiales bacterium RIFCSPHIGHO2_12_FULL_69_20]